MKLEMKNSSLLKKFITSYLGVLLIPILIFTGMYFATSHIIENITYFYQHKKDTVVNVKILHINPTGICWKRQDR